MAEIGIAILSTNRPECLKRLIHSIEVYTEDLSSIDLYILDDSSINSDYQEIFRYIDTKPYIKFKHVGERVGVARNSNYCLQQLKNNKYKLILNNDVEILKEKWESFYFDSMKKTKFHAYCFRQLSLWGACKQGENGKNCVRPDARTVINGVEIATIMEKPHGAVLALDKKTFDTVGYFDEDFGVYGSEHHDFYFRISESDIQPVGIHDLGNSNDYFKIHNEQSCIPFEQRTAFLKQSYKILDEKRKSRKKIYVDFKG